MSLTIAGLTWEPGDLGWTATFTPKSATIGKLPIDNEIHIRLDEAEDLLEAGQPLPTPRAEQVASIEHFFQNEAAIYDEILRQMVRFCQQRFEEDPDFFEDLEEVDSIEALEPLIGSFEISIESQAVDGHAWIALFGDCEWEVEHGTGICIWKDLVLDIGTHDTVMDGLMSEYQLLPPLENAERQAKRMHVIQQLELAAEAHAEAVRAEYEADMPESVHLATAIMAGDKTRAQELIDQGVRLDQYPKEYGSPIIAAIHGCDLEAVRQLLDLGYPANRKAEGMTPLKQAKQMLQGMEMSNQLQSQLLGDLATMLGGDSPEAGGLMSMLGDLQSAAEEVMSQLDGEDGAQPVPLHNMERLLADRLRIQKTEKETSGSVAQLEKIIELLENHKRKS